MEHSGERPSQPRMARPFVTVSYAQTLDGRLATASGSSRWISGPESLRFAHELRASHAAVMVGIETVLADDPRLTVRLVPGRDPLRIIADSSLRTPLSAAVLANGAGSGTIVAVTDAASEARREAARGAGATVLPMPSDEMGRVDLTALLTALAGRGIGSIMVEGGARLITSLLRLRLVDRLAICVAPKVLGAGIDAVGDLGICDLGRALRLADARVTPYGVDIVIDGRVTYEGTADGR